MATGLTTATAPLLYHPTQLEEAYALYLLEQELGIPVHQSPATASADNNVVFRIPGRQAVPFLTRSGLDRTLLRTFWTIADPLNVGTLTDRSQFHTLLRLIAMTQAGVIASLASVETLTINSLLQQWATHPLPLPTFGGLAIPEATFLMTTYWAKLLAVQPLANPGQPVSISDAFGDLPVLDAPLPALVAPTVEPPALVVPTVEPPALVVPTVEPPALVVPTVEPPAADERDFQNETFPPVEEVEHDEEDEFGNFEGVEEPTERHDVPAQSAIPTIPIGTNSSELVPASNFDSEATIMSSSTASSWPGKQHIQSFYSAQESLSLGVESAVSKDTVAVIENEEVDDFGDFENALESNEVDIPTDKHSTHQTTSSTPTPTTSTFLPSTANFSDTATPAIDHSAFPSAETIGTNLTAANGVFNYPMPIAGSSTDPDDPFSAFDALAPPPIPFTSSFDQETLGGGATVLVDEHPNSHVTLDTEEEFDDFGEFEAAENTGNLHPQSSTTVEQSLDKPILTEDQVQPEADALAKDIDFMSNMVDVALPNPSSSTVPSDSDDPFKAFDSLVPPPPSLETQAQDECLVPEAKEPNTDDSIGQVEGLQDSDKSTFNPLTTNDAFDETQNTMEEPTSATSTDSASNNNIPVIVSDSQCGSCDELPPPTSVESTLDECTTCQTWTSTTFSNSSIVQSATAIDDDPFAAFDALVAPQPELPPLSKLSLVTKSADVSSSPELATLYPESLEITEAPMVSSVGTSVIENHDALSDFMFIGKPTESNNGKCGSSEFESKLPEFGGQEQSTQANAFYEDMDFGDFDSAKEAIGKEANMQSPEGVDDQFDFFLSAMSPTSANEDQPEIINNDELKDCVGYRAEDDDFGDFEGHVTSDSGDIKRPGAVDLDSCDGVIVVQEDQANEIEEEFGNFTDFEADVGQASSDALVTTMINKSGNVSKEIPQNGVLHDHTLGRDVVNAFDQGDVVAEVATVFDVPSAKHDLDTSVDDWGAFLDAPASTEQDVVAIDEPPSTGLIANETGEVELASPEDDSPTIEDEWGSFHDTPSISQASQDDVTASIHTSYKNQAIDLAATTLIDEDQPRSDSAAPDDDEWGAFEDTPASSKDLDVIAETTEGFNGDEEWGAFDDRCAPTEGNLSVEYPSKDFVKQRTDDSSRATNGEESKRKFLALIRTLSPHLPPEILSQSGAKAGVENFVTVVETNVQAFKTDDKQAEQRMKRCAEVLLKLSSTHSKLASTLWNQMLTILRDELALGASILDDAIGMSPRDLAVIRQHLRTLVGGFAEYMRLCRSIVATVGDLLCLNLSSSLTDESLNSSWCSISFLELAVESERLWKTIQLAVLSLRMGDAITSRKLESVSELRSSCLEQYSRPTRLCHLTLQPLATDDRSTKGEVSWDGKSYQAHAANFWANRVSTVAP